MGAYVVVREGEDLDSALTRFAGHCRRDQARPWTKRRYGYYESPSALRRKRKRWQEMKARARGRKIGRMGGWKSYPVSGSKIGLPAQFSRTGPTISVGK
ncbi:MAG TPA: 30S ribosomal protein S21 [Armatimonadota bacterium]|nr:30S ribosomal protein S21 [Armatimonadota bacterium]